MQICPECGQIYDESEFAKCPFCENDDITSDDWEEYEDPGYEYVYDEYGNCVSCPNCGAPELRFNNGQCYCIECEMSFTDEEIEEHAGPWTHS